MNFLKYPQIIYKKQIYSGFTTHEGGKISK